MISSMNAMVMPIAIRQLVATHGARTPVPSAGALAGGTWTASACPAAPATRASAGSALASAPVAEAAGQAEAAQAEAVQVPPASAPADGTGVLAPWVATGCRIAMGITMAFMLLIMI